jgi:hypothetical protein
MEEIPLVIATIVVLAVSASIMLLTYKLSHSGSRRRDQVGKTA